MFKLFFGIFFFLVVNCTNCGQLFSNHSKNNNISILNADSISKISHKIILKGNVHLKDKLIEICADEIVYNKHDKTIQAKGNVTLKDSKQNIYYAEKMDLFDSLKKGNIKNIQIKLSDNSRISAKESLINLSECSSAKNVKFSSCESCAVNPDKPLTWEIDSEEIVYDHESENISYKNSVFKFLGVPVFYFPRFVQLSPKIKRKSGFLFPRIIMSKKLGIIAINSYIFALSKSSELLLNLALTSKGDRLLFGEFNKKYLNADIHIGASITDNVGIKKYLHNDLTKEEKLIADKIKKRGFRGHIDAKFNFWNKSKDMRFFSDVKLLSDKSYFNRYSFIPNENNEDDLNFEKSFYETNFGLEMLQKNKYGLLKFITFQNTLTNDTDYNTPLIAPYCEFDYNKPLNNFYPGGNLKFYLSFMNCDFKGEEKDRKLYAKISYLKSYIHKSGILFNLNCSIISHFINADNNQFKNKQINNLSPQFSLKTSYPFYVTYTNGHTSIFTPVMLLVSSLKINKNFKQYLTYSNEFGDYFEINKSNMLFDDVNAEINNCFTENRAVLGINYEHFTKKKIFDIFAGRMFFTRNTKINYNRGISSRKSSDLILNGNIYLSEYLTVNYNARMSDFMKNFPSRNLLVNFTKDTININAGLSKGSMYNLNENKSKYETFFIDGKWIINQHYELFGAKHFGDRNCKSLSHNLGIRYQDECFSCEIKFERAFYRKVDCKSDTRIILSFSLKNLGDFKINQIIKNKKEYGYF